MNGRRIYHARGKVLGGSSSINGMIFQRGNPLDYERWAADPGMETWDYAHCLPYFKRMENCLAGRRRVARRQTARCCWSAGPATNPLFGAFFEAVQQAGYPLTDDVNGYRQEGFARFDRNIHRGRRLSAARAYLHPVMKPTRTSTVQHPGARVHASLFEGKRAVGVEYRRGGGRTRCSVRRRRGDLCGGAFNSPQLLQLSGVGDASDLDALGIARGARPARRRREPAGPPRGLHPARLHAAGVDRSRRWQVAAAVHRAAVAVLARGPGCHQPLRGRRLHPQQRRRRLPQPDVPLPADRDPLRRLARPPASTATRCTSVRCTPTPAGR